MEDSGVSDAGKGCSLNFKGSSFLEDFGEEWFSEGFKAKGCS